MLPACMALTPTEIMQLLRTCAELNKVGITMGSCARFSTCQKIAVTSTSRIMPPLTGKLSKLCSGAVLSTLLTASINALRPSISSMVPLISNGAGSLPLWPGSIFTAPIMSTNAMGRLIANSHCHENRRKMPPRIGPMRNAMPHTAPRMPSAGPRSLGGSLAPITEAAAGNTPPAPKPCMARPKLSIHADSANTICREPVANSEILMM